MHRLTQPFLLSFTLALTACAGGPGHVDDAPWESVSLGASPSGDIPQASGLRARNHFGSIWLSWDDPGLVHFDSLFVRTHIYRNTTDDFTTATEIGSSGMSFFIDRDVEPDTTYYYWIRWESPTTGELGPESQSAWGGADPGSIAREPDDEATEDTAELEEDEAPALAFPRDESEDGYSPQRAYLLPDEVVQAPIYHDGKHLYVGIDQGRDVLQALASSGTSSSSASASKCTSGGCYRLSTSYRRTTTVDEQDDWTLRYGEVQESRTLNGVRQGLRSYFDNTAQLARSGAPVVMRFETVPTIRFGGMVSTADIARLGTVVQIINSALPSDWKLEMATGVPEAEPDDLSGTIYVEFLPKSEYRRAVDYSSLGNATAFYSTVDARISHAHIQINRSYAKNGEMEAAIVLAHELIHSLGIGHATRGMASMMQATPPTDADDLPLPILYRDDRRALNALYSDMSPGDLVTSLGPWDDTVSHLAANNDHVAFGVAYADGYGEPWAYGLHPEMALASNPDLLGTARWAGMLLGFTSDDDPLSGKAALAVHLDDLTGAADFTELETWTKGSLPGEAGSGSDWSTGDLSYDILVTGNTFRQTGGDDGTVTGAFFGESHEAMGGVLEREDLTAAFGGERD